MGLSPQRARRRRPRPLAEPLESRWLLSTAYHFDLAALPSGQGSGALYGSIDAQGEFWGMAAGANLADLSFYTNALHGDFAQGSSATAAAITPSTVMGIPSLGGDTVIAGGTFGEDAGFGIIRRGKLSQVVFGDTSAPSVKVLYENTGFTSPTNLSLALEIHDRAGLELQSLFTALTVTFSGTGGQAPGVGVSYTRTDHLPEPQTVRMIFSITVPPPAPSGPQTTYQVHLVPGTIVDTAGNSAGSAASEESWIYSFSAPRNFQPTTLELPDEPEARQAPSYQRVAVPFALAGAAAVRPDGSALFSAYEPVNSHHVLLSVGATGRPTAAPAPLEPSVFLSKLIASAPDAALGITYDGDLLLFRNGGTEVLDLHDWHGPVLEAALASDGKAAIISAKKPGAASPALYWAFPGYNPDVLCADQDGYLQPGETWFDNNGNGRFDEGILTVSKLAPSAKPIYEDRGFAPEGPIALVPRTDASGDYYEALFSAAGQVYTLRFGKDLSQQTAPEPLFYGSSADTVTLGGLTWRRDALQIALADQPLNDRGDILLKIGFKGQQGVYFMARARELGRRPLLFLHGVSASGSSGDFDTWLMQLGVPPQSLVEDPFTNGYDDIIDTFEAVGYVRDSGGAVPAPDANLFVANYDWRLPAAPDDGSADGLIHFGAASLSSNALNYSVDYVRYWLGRAAQAWQAKYGEPLDRVDLVAHSMGGLVARAYIQSDLYGATVPGGSTLPRVAEFTTIATPHFGSPKAFQLLNNNWSDNSAYWLFMGKIVAAAYHGVLTGRAVTDSAGQPKITLQSITGPDGRPDPLKFILAYAPSARDLLSTYPFLVPLGGGAPQPYAQQPLRNYLLLDLNVSAGVLGGPSSGLPLPGLYRFSTLTRATVLFGDGAESVPQLNSEKGGDGSIQEMWDFLARSPDPDEIWYQNVTANVGDGTVPVDSSRNQFNADTRIVLRGFVQAGTSPEPGLIAASDDPIGHTDMPANRDVQRIVLQQLSISAPSSAIQYRGLAMRTVEGLVQTVYRDLDPARAVLFSTWGSSGLNAVAFELGDELGRHLGKILGGSVSEMPDGFVVGDETALGGARLDDSTGNLTLRVVGTGQPFTFRLVRWDNGKLAGFALYDTIPAGEERRYDLPAPVDAELVPELQVLSAGQPIPRNPSAGQPTGTSFGSVLQSQTLDRVFTVQNSGQTPLLIPGRIELSGPGASQFDVVSWPQEPIAPGGSGQLVVRFKPTAEGNQVALVSINSTDPHTQAFTFAVSGQGVASQSGTPGAKGKIVAKSVAIAGLGNPVLGGQKSGSGTATVTLANTTGTRMRGRYTVTVYAVRGAALDPSHDPVIGKLAAAVDLPARKSKPFKIKVQLPPDVQDRDYRLIATVAGPGIAKGVATANSQAPSVHVKAQYIDLVRQTDTLKAQGVRRGASFSIAVPITNTGNAAAKGKLNISIFLSPSGAGAAVSLPTRYGVPINIPAGQTRSVTLTFKAPSSLHAGQYSILVIASSGASLWKFERNPTLLSYFGALTVR